jgi:hypothetical protein
MSPRAHGSRNRGRRTPPHRRAHRFAGLLAVSIVLVVTLLLAAFGGSSLKETAVASSRPQVGTVLPLAEIVATTGPLRLQLPIAQGRVTAIGYHGAGEGTLRLDPLGERGNKGWLGRLRDRIFGSGGDSLVWYQLSGGDGPSTSSLDVGAAAGTDVFSPVDGTIVGIQEVVIDQRKHGVRIDIQPTSAPSLIVSVSGFRADPALTVGAAVVAAKTRIGTLLDLSKVERMGLADYTQDAGNHVSLVVRPAATFSLP